MHSLFVVALLFGAALAAPPSPKHQRVVGGTVTSINEYNYMASLHYLQWGLYWGHSCGGAMLTTRTMLSASHCFEGTRPSEWRFRLGSSQHASGGSLHYPSQLIMHPQYDIPSLNNDVAIAILTAPVTLSSSIGLARIAGPNYILPDGTTITTLGWGTTQYQGSLSAVLLKADVEIVNQELCAERYAYLKTQPGYAGWPDITPEMMCAGVLDVGGRDACQGDSGGPFVHNDDVIVGVTSWGYRCAESHYPGVVARVHVLSDWIVDNASV